MDFESTIMQLFSASFFGLSLFIAALTFVVRKFFEYSMSKHSLNTVKLWNDLILPILPVFLGALIGLLVKQYPYPAMWKSTFARMEFAIIAGFFSAYSYRLLKGLVNSKLASLKAQTAVPTTPDTTTSVPAATVTTSTVIASGSITSSTGTMQAGAVLSEQAGSMPSAQTEIVPSQDSSAEQK